MTDLIRDRCRRKSLEYIINVVEDNNFYFAFSACTNRYFTANGTFGTYKI